MEEESSSESFQIFLYLGAGHIHFVCNLCNSKVLSSYVALRNFWISEFL